MNDKKKKTKTIKKSKIVVREKLDSYGQTMAALVEDAESQLQLAEVKGKIIDKLAYSFKGKTPGTKVEGLTFWGLLACTEFSKKKDRWSPEWTQPQYQVMNDDAVLLTIGCVNPKTKKTEWGNCIFHPRLRFSERTALTNAKRYALDKHISIPQKVTFVQFLKANDPKKVLQLEEGKEKTDGFVVSDAGDVKTKKLKVKKEKETINL